MPIQIVNPEQALAGLQKPPGPGMLSQGTAQAAALAGQRPAPQRMGGGFGGQGMEAVGEGVSQAGQAIGGALAERGREKRQYEYAQRAIQFRADLEKAAQERIQTWQRENFLVEQKIRSDLAASDQVNRALVEFQAGGGDSEAFTKAQADTLLRDNLRMRQEILSGKGTGYVKGMESLGEVARAIELQKARTTENEERARATIIAVGADLDRKLAMQGAVQVKLGETRNQMGAGANLTNLIRVGIRTAASLAEREKVPGVAEEERGRSEASMARRILGQALKGIGGPTFGDFTGIGEVTGDFLLRTDMDEGRLPSPDEWDREWLDPDRTRQTQIPPETIRPYLESTMELVGDALARVRLEAQATQLKGGDLRLVEAMRREVDMLSAVWQTTYGARYLADGMVRVAIAEEASKSGGTQPVDVRAVLWRLASENPTVKAQIGPLLSGVSPATSQPAGPETQPAGGATPRPAWAGKETYYSQEESKAAMSRPEPAQEPMKTGEDLGAGPTRREPEKSHSWWEDLLMSPEGMVPGS